MILFFLIIIRNSIYADTNEQMVVEQMQQLQGSFGVNNNAGEFLGYSESEAMKTGENLDNLNDAELKNKAGQKMEAANMKKGSMAENITAAASNKRTLEGFENHSMFTKADEIFKDPITMLNKLTAVKCKKILGTSANHYTKKTITETKYDTEIEEQICEQPAGNIVCEKTLNLECESTQNCENKTISITSSSPELIVMTSDLGWVMGLNKNTSRYYNQLHILRIFIDFKVFGSERVNKLLFSKIRSKSPIRILLNGTEVFNSLNSNSKFDIYHQQYKKLMSFHKHGDSSGGEKTCYKYYVASNEVSLLCLDDQSAADQCWQDVIATNVDAKNLVKEGNNKIEIELVYIDPTLGDLEIEIETKQQCCNKFKDVWVERCWQE